MFCSKCGYANADGAAFCSKCGEPSASIPVGADPLASSGDVLSPSAGTGSAEAFDEDVWRAVIGPRNVDYYLPRFRRRHQGGGGGHWHWPAFFVTFYWLLYRKMWLWAVAYFVVPYLISLGVGIAIGLGGANSTLLSGLFTIAFVLVMTFGPPLFANTLYYAHCRSVIDKQMRVANTRERLLGQLEGRGGTSSVVWIVVVFLGIAIIGMLAAIALPAYQDYTKRAKSAEAIASAMNVAHQVGSYAERTKDIPADLSAFPLDDGARRYLADMRLDPTTGVITLDITFGPGAGEATAYLVPKMDASGHVTWQCRSEPATRKYLPRACREN